MTKNKDYFQKLENFINSAEQNLNQELSRIENTDFTDEELNKYIEKFHSITSLYLKDLNTLYNLINYSSTSSNCKADNNIINFVCSNMLNIHTVICSSPLMSYTNFNKFISENPFTIQEINILKLICMYRHSYQHIYKNDLKITKRTFDDHLARIANKLYSIDQIEIKGNHNYKCLMPKFATKELEDGTKTYANPYKLILEYFSVS